MRNGTNPRKSRGRNNNNNVRRNNSSNGNTNYRPQTVYESNGPEGKIRGNAQQIYEKYIALATDAAVSDDKVRSESFYQHAEHYLRMMLRDTDIDYDTYRQEQQRRRENRENGIVDADIEMTDMADANDDDKQDTQEDDVIAIKPNRTQRRPSRKPSSDTQRKTDGDTTNRMIDPPSFLASATQAPIEKKEIKIDTPESKQEKVLEAEMV